MNSVHDANQLGHALRLLMAIPKAESIILDTRDDMKAERERLIHSARMEDNRILADADGNGRMAKGVSADSPDDSIWPVIRESVDKVAGRTIRALGKRIPAYGEPITDPVIVDLLIASGHKIHLPDTSESRVIGLDVNGHAIRVDVPEDELGMTLAIRGGKEDKLTDHPSRVAPLTRGISDSGFTDVKSRADQGSILGRMYVDSAGKRVDAIWQGIGTVMDQGFYFTDDSGTEIRIPTLAAMAGKATTRFGAHGKALMAERVDDVVSSSLMRSYLMMRALILSTEAEKRFEDFIGFDNDALGTVAVHAPMGEIAGIMERRAVRCGECKPCRDGSMTRGMLIEDIGDTAEDRAADMERAIHAATTNVKSRYHIGPCLSPTLADPSMVDIQLIMHRAIYAEADAHVSDEREDLKRFATAEEREALAEDTNMVIVDAASEFIVCGHTNCTQLACRVMTLVNAARIVCDTLQRGTVAKNGGLSTDFLDIVSAIIYGNGPTPSQSRARRHARDLIIGALSGDSGHPAIRAFVAESDRRAREDASMIRLARHSGHVTEVRHVESVSESVPTSADAVT